MAVPLKDLLSLFYVQDNGPLVRGDRCHALTLEMHLSVRIDSLICHWLSPSTQFMTSPVGPALFWVNTSDSLRSIYPIHDGFQTSWDLIVTNDSCHDTKHLASLKKRLTMSLHIGKTYSKHLRLSTFICLLVVSVCMSVYEWLSKCVAGKANLQSRASHSSHHSVGLSRHSRECKQLTNQTGRCWHLITENKGFWLSTSHADLLQD